MNHMNSETAFLHYSEKKKTKKTKKQTNLTHIQHSRPLKSGIQSETRSAYGKERKTNNWKVEVFLNMTS